MEDLINELYILRQIELADTLNESEQKRYLEIVEMCNANDIQIPFGIEI